MHHVTAFATGRRRALPGGLFVVAVLLTLYYGVISDGPLPDHRLIVGFNDLFLHAMAFLVLSFLAFLIWGHVVRSVLALGLVAVILEFVQIFEPMRDANLLDVLASLSGVFAGLCLFLGLRWLAGFCQMKP